MMLCLYATQTKEHQRDEETIECRFHDSLPPNSFSRTLSAAPLTLCMSYCIAQFRAEFRTWDASWEVGSDGSTEVME